jgi:chromosome segregation ATPase
MTPTNDDIQEVDIYRTRVVATLEDIQKVQSSMQEAIRSLSETLANHMKQNIDMLDGVNRYIGDQMQYRTFRQNIEENNLTLELEKKRLELEFAQRRMKQLEDEQHEDDEDTKTIRLEYEKQKLEIESMKRSMDILQEARHSTQEKIKSMKSTTAAPPPAFSQKMKETIILTALGATTAAAVGGVIAFFIFFIRFYIENAP